MNELTLENIRKVVKETFKEEFKTAFKEEFKTAFKEEFKTAFKEEFDSEIKPFTEELKQLKNNIGTLNDKFERYIKKDSDGIEYEINKNVKHFLKQKYTGNIIKQLPIKSLKTYTNSDDVALKNLLSSKLTEFDGIFSIEFKNIPKIETKKLNEIVIVEAKHNVSINQINEKMCQMFYFKKILEKSKTDLTNVKDKSFLKFCQSFKLQLTDNKFYFYIGGPTWETGAMEYLQKINTGVLENLIWKNTTDICLNLEEEKELLNHIKGHIGIIAPDGTRYKLYDNINYTDEILNEDDILFTSHETYKTSQTKSSILKTKPESEILPKIENERDNDIMYGGKIYKGLEMKILPNYMNIKYF